jgi:hypothetical protein
MASLLSSTRLVRLTLLLPPTSQRNVYLCVHSTDERNNKWNRRRVTDGGISETGYKSYNMNVCGFL